ncbi:MAG TPA: tryptophan 2,3-dioxygenase, partial [Xanthomonadales bacterium]|nr:tryptophan 2,3-dioxygenase [Xanthomonadales bacterium]
FIVQHQTSELWMKLMLHELRAAIGAIAADRMAPAFKMLARVSRIMEQLVHAWDVLATMTPPEYSAIRPYLASSSGFQSWQYRCIEFMLGNKNADMLAVFDHDPAASATLAEALAAPSLYDEFLLHLARTGHAVPNGCTARDWRRPHVRCPDLVPVLARIYRDPAAHWDAYHLCELLVDVENGFQFWRFRHMKTVERIIGYRRGTGGSSGVGFLKQALELSFFPELYEVRSVLDQPASTPADA